MKKLKNKKRKGITLIVVTSIMLVLSTTAVTFVRLTGYERTAASNYASTIDAKLTAYAGVDHALAIVYNNIRTKGRIALNEEINGIVLQYPINSNRDVFQASQQGQTISLETAIDLHDGAGDDNFAVSGLVGRAIRGGGIFGTSEPNGNFYSLKLEDTSGKINVNSFIAIQENGSPIVEASVQERSAEVFARILQSLASSAFPDSAENFRTDLVNAIIGSPINVNAERFTNMQELENRLRTVVGFDGDQADRFLSNLTTSSFIDTKTVGVEIENVVDLRDAPSYYLEARAPININTASRDVLVALIENITGRANFFANDVGTVEDPTFGESTIEVETTLRNEIIQYEIIIPQAEALALADEIIDRRDSNSFLDQGEIDEFLNEQNIDIDLPNVDQAVNNLNVVKSSPSLAGRTVITQELWDQAIRDMLRSNFNPNVIENFWNPNSDVYRRVSTSDLMRIENNGTDLVMTPSHTIELVPFSVGSVEITSVGRTTANQGNLVTGVSVISTTANFGRQVTHTTQEDFESDTPLVDTVTSPNNIPMQRSKVISNFEDSFAGAVEPNSILELNSDDIDDADVLYFSGRNFVNESDNDGDGDVDSNDNKFHPDDDIANTDNNYITPVQWSDRNVLGSKTIDYPQASTPDPNPATVGLPKLMRARTSVRSQGNNLAYDGLISRKMYYTPNFVRTTSPVNIDIGIRQQDSLERYLIETCFEDFSTSLNAGENFNSYTTNRANPAPDLRNNNTSSSGTSKMANIRGSIQFWVKFDADDSDGVNNQTVASGLFGATTASGFRQGRDIIISSETGGDVFGRGDPLFREGTQTYVYANALGELRVSRLYYALCFPIGSDTPYGAFFDTDVDANNRRVPRRDVIMKTAPFKAHEWYHIRVRWDDGLAGRSSIDLFVNDIKVTTNNVANVEVVDELDFGNEYCLLNEREPIDAMYIGGFPRPQAKVGGYFHFDTDVHMPGNATIDQFISSSDPDFSFRSGPSRRRFDGLVNYNNFIDLNDDDEIIAAIHWTSYPPYRAEGDDSGDTPRVRLASVGINGGAENTSITFEEEGGERREFIVAEKMFPGNTILDTGQQVQYKFEFLSPRPGQPSNANATLKGARCATLDSVTLVTIKKYPVMSDTIIQ